mgnify:CR=1 FL=1
MIRSEICIVRFRADAVGALAALLVVLLLSLVAGQERLFGDLVLARYV